MTLTAIIWTVAEEAFVQSFIDCLVDRGLNLEAEFFESDDGTPCFAVVTPNGESLMHCVKTDEGYAMINRGGHLVRRAGNLDELIHGDVINLLQ